ncbi:MAG: hypothetical protein ACRCZF_25595, partial [Gemmataceae bacterium]
MLALVADTDIQFLWRPLEPWSREPFGLPLFGLLALVLIGLTLWAYLGHRQITRRRLSFILILRLFALMVALLTALRPTLAILEEPKVPSQLLIGIDMSESMTVQDEFNSQSRIDAVRKILERCEPILEELRTKEQVNVQLYGFGPTDFQEAQNRYDPAAAAVAKKSDYGIYLGRTYDRWQSERFHRGHILIGDGVDNGTQASALAEATRWRSLAPITTFSVGSDRTDSQARDVALTAAIADPTPVPIKNEYQLKLQVNAAGFVGAKVPVVIEMENQQIAKEEFILRQAVNNELTITLKAPEKPGEYKLTARIPIDSVPGDVAPQNNIIETFLTVTKDGVRVLLIDRIRQENAQLTRALAAEKRFNIARALRQSDGPPSPEERAIFDFDTNSYDVILLGNVSAKQLRAVDPQLPEKIRDQVTKKGAGLITIGGDAGYGGSPARALDNGWVNTAIEGLLPVNIRDTPRGVPTELFRTETNRFAMIPTLDGLQYLCRVGVSEESSRQLWDKLNDKRSFTRLSAINGLGEPKPGAVVYAVGTEKLNDVTPAGTLRADQARPPYLLVGWEIGEGAKGRVISFAGFDTYTWKPLGLRDKPSTRDGIELHAQFWRRMVLWAAHQDQDESAAFARPEFRRLPVRGKQTVRVGLRGPGGADVKDPSYEVKIVAPGQKPEDAATRPVVQDGTGTPQVPFEPGLPGEYTV